MSVKLKNFESWLLFCLVYVPVIPLMTAAVLGGYFYMRSHRTVHCVNGLPVPIDVDFDGGRVVTLLPHAHTSLSMGEGKHRAVVSSPRLGIEPVEFRIGGQGSSGLFSAPTWIVDPTRSALLLWEEAVYLPPPGTRRAGESRAHLGEAFITCPHVDYIFQEFPSETEICPSSPVRKTRISLVTAPAHELADALRASPGRTGEALSFIENHLRVSPDDVALLSHYWAIARRQDQIKRCRDFLAPRLAERPVLMNCHRLYQTICENSGDDAALVERYDSWLAADPDNSALLYLRGRCDPERAAAWEFYKKAITADPRNAYPRLAESVVLLSRGEFAAAETSARVACHLRPDDAQMKRHLARVRMALGEYDVLEAELRAAVLLNPRSLPEQQQLLVVLAAADKLGEAEQALADFNHRLTTADPSQAAAMTRQLRDRLLYVQGDFAGLLADTAAEAASDAEADESALARYWAKFELRQVIQPPLGVNPVPSEHQGYSLLCQSLAWVERGDAAAAADARVRAIDEFRVGGFDDRQIAALLARGDDWTDHDLDNLPLDPTQKCIVLVAMAQESGERAAPLLALAEKLNFERHFPYHFVRRTIERLRRRGDARGEMVREDPNGIIASHGTE